MGRRGPIPKPGSAAWARHQIKPAAVNPERPPAPGYLPADLLDLYNRLANDALAAGAALRVSDGHVIGVAAVALQALLDARSSGKFGPVQLMRLAREAMNALEGIALSPRARVRLGISADPKPKPRPDADSALDEALFA